MFMLTDEVLLKAFAHLNPKMASYMNYIERFRAFGMAEDMDDVLCKLEDTQQVMLFQSVKCYYAWLATVYLPADEYPGSSTGNTPPSTTAVPCPPTLPTEPSGFAGSFSIDLECEDPPVAVAVDLADAFGGDYFDRTSAAVHTAPSKGTAVIDHGLFKLYYTPDEGEEGSDLMVVSIRDVYGRTYYAPCSILIDCSGDGSPDCTGFTGATVTPITIGAEGSEDMSGMRINTFTAAPVGGTGPFTYEWTVEDPCVIFGADNQPTVFVKYDPLEFPILTREATCVITDANGCTQEASAYVAFYEMECEGATLDVVHDTPLDIDLGAIDGITSYTTGIIVGPQVYAMQNYNGPNHGTLTVVDAALGLVTYEPDSGWSGTDSFDYAWLLGVADDMSLSKTSLCTITLNTALPEPICPEAVLEVTNIFQALEDPEAVIAGTDLLMLELTTTNVTDVSQLSIVFKNGGTGTVLDTPDLTTWQFSGGVLYGGVSIPDNQLVRIEITADNGCGEVDLLYFHDLHWNEAPLAFDESVQCQNTGSVFINLLGDDYDPEGQDITLIMIDDQEFDSGPNNIITLDAGQGTVEWVDGIYVKYTPPSSALTTYGFTYTIQDSPGNPLEALTATANVSVETVIKHLGSVNIVTDSIEGDEGARTIDLSLVITDINLSRSIEWFVNTGAGYGSADAQTTETATFSEPPNIISIQVVVTETAGLMQVYVAEIDLSV